MTLITHSLPTETTSLAVSLSLLSLSLSLSFFANFYFLFFSDDILAVVNQIPDVKSEGEEEGDKGNSGSLWPLSEKRTIVKRAQDGEPSTRYGRHILGRVIDFGGQK